MTPIQTNEWKLIDLDTGNTILTQTHHKTFRGESLLVTGGYPPKHDGSTGRVHGNGWEYFPGVLNMKWERMVWQD
jgi:hypothetical protein